MSGATATLKEQWEDQEVSKLFDEGALFLDVLESGDQGADQAVRMSLKREGKYVIAPLHTAGNPNVGIGVAEGYPYPVEGSQSYAQAKYRCRSVVAAIGLTREVMNRAGGGDQSVLDWQATEDAKTIANIRRKMNFIYAGNGSGKFTDATGYTNGTGTLDVGDSSNIPIGAEIIVRDLLDGNPTGVPSGNTTSSLPTGWPVTLVTTGNPARVRSKTSTTLVLENVNDGSLFDHAMAESDHDFANATFGVYFHDEQGRVPWGVKSFALAANPTDMGFNGATTVTAVDDGGTAAAGGIGLLNVPGAIDRSVAANAFWNAISSSDLTLALNRQMTIEDDIQPLDEVILGRDSMISESDEIPMIAASRKGIWWKIVNQLNSGQRTEIRRFIEDGRYEYVKYGKFVFTYDQTLPSGEVLFFAPRYLFRMVVTPWGPETLDSTWNQIHATTLHRPTSAFRKNLVTEQQLCATSCRPNALFTSVL